MFQIVATIQNLKTTKQVTLTCDSETYSAAFAARRISYPGWTIIAFEGPFQQTSANTIVPFSRTNK